MAKNKLLIRCDANETIGRGHLFRCLALADMLSEEFIVVFYLLSSDEEAIVAAKQSGYMVHLIPDEQTFLNDLSPQTIAVLDGYQFNSNYQQALKSTGAPLVFIDDLHKGVYYADLIINHAGGATVDMYQTSPETKFLLGPRYALLRKEFIEASLHDRLVTRIKQVFVCFGGSWQGDLIVRSTTAILDAGFEGSIHLLAGPMDHQTQSILQRQGVSVHRGLSAPGVRDLIASCELAMVASSNISLEAFATGVFIITGMTAENQRDIYNGFRNMEFICRLDNLGEITAGKLRSALAYFENLGLPYRIPKREMATQSIISNFLNLKNK